MQTHSDAIELIEDEITGIENRLSKSGKVEALVERKNSLVKSLRLLRQLATHEIDPKAAIYSLPLPRYSGHFSEFRIMDDNETEDREQWTELEIEGAPLKASVGDLVILNSGKR